MTIKKTRLQSIEAVVQRCSVKKVFLETLSGVTKCFTLWKFVTVSYSNRLLPWKKYVQ